MLKMTLAPRKTYKDILLHNKNIKIRGLVYQQILLTSDICLNDFLWEELHLKQAGKT